MLYDGELDHQHQNLENEVTNTRRDLNGTHARLVEVDNELGAVRADLCTTRHAIVELDDALTALRAEFAEFKQHVAAFARLAGETEADRAEEYLVGFIAAAGARFPQPAPAKEAIGA